MAPPLFAEFEEKVVLITFNFAFATPVTYVW